MFRQLEVNKDSISIWISRFSNKCQIINNYRLIRHRSIQICFNKHNSPNRPILKRKSRTHNILRALEKAHQRAPSTMEYSRIKPSQEHQGKLDHSQILRNTFSQQTQWNSKTTLSSLPNQIWRRRKCKLITLVKLRHSKWVYSIRIRSKVKVSNLISGIKSIWCSSNSHWVIRMARQSKTMPKLTISV